VEQFKNDNGNDEIIVLDTKYSPHIECDYSNNRWVDRILTILLFTGILFLFIFTFGSTYKTYWVYLINFLVLPFIGFVSVSLSDKRKENIIVYIGKVLFRIIVIIFIFSEAIMQYNSKSIFATIKALIMTGLKALGF
jgi:hypothetical protein